MCEKRNRKYIYSSNPNFNTENTTLDIGKVNLIICDDSINYLKSLPDNCIDIICTSPPYNFNKEYDKTNDDKEWNEYFDDLFLIFDECIRVLKYGGRFVVNVQPLFSDYIPTHSVITNYLMQKDMIWKGEILWEKNNYNCKVCSWGSWRSPSSPYLKYTWEFVEVFCKGTIKKIGDKEKIDIDSEEFKTWVTAKWSIAPERRMKEFGHPAMYPEELVERILKLFSYQGDVVLDPFNGAGTTSVVAKRTGRKYIGVDISNEYCQIAKKRLAEIDCSVGVFDDV